MLPVDDLGITGPLLVVGREASVASGSIDLVGVVLSGDLVLVEFKTGPQNPDFRHALAQLIDYGSALLGMTVDDFDNGVVQRHLEGTYCPSIYKGCETISGLAELAWKPEEFVWDEFVDRLARVLSDGDFHYVVAAQKFTPQMTRSLEYLAIGQPCWPDGVSGGTISARCPHAWKAGFRWPGRCGRGRRPWRG